MFIQRIIRNSVFLSGLCELHSGNCHEFYRGLKLISMESNKIGRYKCRNKKNKI